MAGTGIGTIFVDENLRILRFTPAVTKIISLIQADIGRPIGHFAANLTGYDRLVEDVRKVLDTLVPVEEEVQNQAGRWFLMHIRPYRTFENVIQGAVVTFVDITERKQMQIALQESQLKESQTQLSEAIVATVREPLLVLDRDLRVLSANRAFYQTFQETSEVTLGNFLYDLGNRQWDIPALRTLLEEILRQNTVFNDYEITHDFNQIGRRTMRLNARCLLEKAGPSGLILLAIEDITERQLKGPKGKHTEKLSRK